MSVENPFSFWVFYLLPQQRRLVFFLPYKLTEPTSITSGNSVSRRRMNAGRTYIHAIVGPVLKMTDGLPLFFLLLLSLITTTSKKDGREKNDKTW